ncbi:TPR domain containing protein [Colletotrichum chrysophilum]|uniref:TPR domain containing protein n=1 Tax=Colletotrichum chrysophilum TaxID=1836956 RepID=A0AAD9B2G1_9PEZI|nr:TPR domain containing protein [Colletotrichum chrysophilum]
MANIERAIEQAILSINAVPGDYRVWPGYLNKLHLALVEPHATITALDIATQLAQNAIDNIPGGYSEREECMDVLSILYRKRYALHLKTNALQNAQDDIGLAINLAQQCYDATPKDHPRWTNRLNRLCSWLNDKCMVPGDATDLDKAIRMVRHALEVTPVPSPDRSDHMSSLSNLLGRKYRSTKADKDFKEALKTTHAAMEFPGGAKHRAVCLRCLAVLWNVRYECSSAIADLQEAIKAAQQVIETSVQGSEEWQGDVRLLGILLHQKHSKTRADSDLEKAIQEQRKAMKSLPRGSWNWTSCCFTLTNLLNDRYSQHSDERDLNEAIQVARENVDATPSNHEDKFNLSMQLLNLLDGKRDSMNDRQESENTIRLARQLLNETPEDDDENQTKLRTILGHWLGDSYSKTGDVDKLDEAIQITREAILYTPSNDPGWVDYRNSLAVWLVERHHRKGVLADLDEAIQLARENVDASHGGERVEELSNLASWLRGRFEIEGALSNLEEAVLLAQRAVEATPLESKNRYKNSMTLAGILKARYIRLRNSEDLDEAIRLARNAVETIPSVHRDWAACAHNLAGDLHDRFQRTISLDDLNEASKFAYAATEATDQDDPRLVVYLNTCGGINQLMWQASSKDEYLDEAINFGRRALQLIEEDHSGRATYANNLANWLIDRHSKSSAATDLVEAKALYATVSSQEMYGVRARIHAGRRFLRLPNILEDDARLAYDIARTTTELVPLLAPQSLQHTDKQHVLAEAVGIASDAAAIALHFQEATEAVRLLETGRGILAGAIQDMRTDLSSLQKSHPSLAEAFIAQRNQLDSPSPTGGLLPGEPGNKVSADQRYNASKALQDTLREIRKIPEFEGFLLPPSDEDIRKTASRGSVVVLNVSSFRCDAIIITPSDIQISQLSEPGREFGSKMVIVAMRETPDEATLEYTGVEKEAILDVTGRADGLQCVMPMPSRLEVLLELESCDVFHFAGHGSAHPTNPLQSQLLLEDWKEAPLTVNSLLERNLDSKSPYLAYLSACGTGEVQDEKSVDELTHLASAFLLAGFRNVVSTLWDVDDEQSARTAKMTYEYILSTESDDDGTVARALNHATRKLRALGAVIVRQGVCVVLARKVAVVDIVVVDVASAFALVHVRKPNEANVDGDGAGHGMMC